MNIEAEGAHNQVPLAVDDTKQAALAQHAKKTRKPLPKPSAPDLRRHHPLSMGRGSAEIQWDGNSNRLVVRNVSEEVARALARECLRGGGAILETEVAKNVPRPGEPADVMSLPKLQDALVKVGPDEALMHEVISLATQGVITRHHAMYETYQTRFCNVLKRCAKALKDQGILVWSRWVRIDGVNLKRFGAGTTVPEGGELIE